MSMTLVPPSAPKPTLLQRILEATGVAKAVRSIATQQQMQHGYFAPGQPVSPQGPKDFLPRREDYSVGYNINIQPRMDEPISFWDLYALAENDNITRLLIETRKDQMAALTWDIRPQDIDNDTDITPEQDARIDACRKFLKSPDGENTFETWIRLLLEDVLVYDAPCVYVNTQNPIRTKFQVVSGMTIARKIDLNGRTPEAPEPAYQQIIHGTVAGEFSTEEMIYKPRNPRPNRVYGMSPVQQIVMTVNLALRKQLSQLYFFSEGTIPDALVTTPPDWTPKQIADFQKYWDEMLAGNLQQKRHAQFVPGGTDIVMTKQEVLTDAADLWFTKIRCYAFSIPPTAFEAKTNRATAQTAKSAAEEEGLAPLMNWAKAMVDECLQKHLGQHDLEFTWVQDDTMDPADQVAVMDTQLRSAALTLNEYREKMGREPYGPDGDEPMIYTASGPVLLKNIINPPAPGEPGGPPLPVAPMGGPGGKPPAGDGKPPANGGGKPPPKTPAQAAKDSQAAGKPVPAGGKVPPKEKAHQQAALRLLKGGDRQTLYIHRPLINADELVEWAKAQGFGSILPPYDMHVTVAFSRAPVDWDMAGMSVGQVRCTTGIRQVQRFDGGAVVLQFTSLQLQNRWQQIRDVGGSWDWAEYKPHITLSYNAPDLDLTQIDPFTGMLEFGPEVFAEVKEGWKDDVKEMDISPDEPEVSKAAAVPFVVGRAALAGGAINKSRPRVRGRRLNPAPRNTALMRKTETVLTKKVQAAFNKMADDVAAQLRAYHKKKIKKYSDDQPREENGRFGSGGDVHSNPASETQGAPLAAQWAQDGKDEGLVSTLSANDPNANAIIYHGTVEGHKDAGFLFVTTSLKGAESHGQVTAYHMKEGAKIYPDLESGDQYKPNGYDSLFNPDKHYAGSSAIIHISDLVPVHSSKVHKAEGDEDDLINADDLVSYLTVDISELDTLAEEDFPTHLSDVYTEAGLTSISMVGAKYGEDVVNQINTRALEFSEERSAELVGKKWVDGELVDNPNAEWAIDESTRDMLNETIYRGLDEGLGIDGLADAIQAMRDEEGVEVFSAGRARMIARTETIMAHGKGDAQGLREAKATGVHVQKEWYADPEACDICQENMDEGPIDLEDEFPSGDGEPPAHPNCECSLNGFVPEEEGDSGDSGDDSEGDQADQSDEEDPDTRDAGPSAADDVEYAAKPDLLKYSEDQERDESGRWTSGGGGGDTASQDTSGGNDGAGQGEGAAPVEGGGSSASELFDAHDDPNVTADQIIDNVPGGREALNEAKDRLAQGTETKNQYSSNGKYTPEREALHQQIIDKYINEANVAAAMPGAGEKPTMTILGGRGGSGKSYLTSAEGPVNGNGINNDSHMVGNALYLNSDDIKESMPEYQGWNAALLHEEASDIFEKVDAQARELGMNVVHDSTMKSGSTAMARLSGYKDAGYNLEGHYMFAPPQQAATQAMGRFMRGTEKLSPQERAQGKTGRMVPPSYILGSRTNEQSFDQARGMFSKWTVYSNTSGSPKLYAKGGH